MTYTDQEKIDELRREIKMRKRVYPRWVQDGRMKQEEADKRIAIFEEMADELEQKGRLL